jgi:hypothetical protein
MSDQRSHDALEACIVAFGEAPDDSLSNTLLVKFAHDVHPQFVELLR